MEWGVICIICLFGQGRNMISEIIVITGEKEKCRKNKTGWMIGGMTILTFWPMNVPINAIKI